MESNKKWYKWTYFFLNGSDVLLAIFFFFLILFMAVLGLRFCARALSSCGKRGPLFIAVRRPLAIAASLVAEHRLQTHRLSNCGPRAQPLCGMWDPPRPGLEPASPAPAGGLSTTAPPGKPQMNLLIFTKQKQTYRHRKQTYGYQKGKGVGKG